MFTLYTWGTTSGRKPLILLEELGLPYEVRPVDINSGAQHAPEFRALNPIGRIPVLVDEDGVVLSESNAILWHLGSLTGQLMGDGLESLRVMQWLFVQGATTAPPLSEYWLLRQMQDPPPSELARQRDNAERVLAALETALTGSRYFAGHFSIADIAFVPQLKRELAEAEHAGRWPALRAWLDRCLARPSVVKGLTMKVA
jgi:GST-like protein